MNDLLFLHGAIGASDQLLPLKKKLETDFTIHLFDFPGHGGKPLPAAGFSIAYFAGSVLQWMDEQGIPSISIFGYSMGGYVGLYLARHYPERVNRVFTLATKFAWDEATAAKEVKMLDPGKIAEKVPKFAQALEQRHAPQDWKQVLAATGVMMQQLGKAPALSDEDYSMIEKPVSIGIGDRDTMVSFEETLHVYRQLPGAQFQVFPKTMHPVEQVNMELLAASIRQFFTY